MLLAMGCARAESSVEAQMDRAGYARLEALARELNVTWMGEAVGRALSGEMLVDANAVQGALRRAARAVRNGLMEALKRIAAPALATALLSLLPGRRNEAMALLCRLACAAALAAPCAEALRAAGDMLSRSTRVTDALAPVLAAAMALTGEGAASAMLTPASALLTEISQGLLLGLGLPLCAVAAAVNVAGGLSAHRRMDRLFALIQFKARHLLRKCGRSNEGREPKQQNDPQQTMGSRQNHVEANIGIIGSQKKSPAKSGANQSKN